MRVAQPAQMGLGEVDISQIQFDLKSRDDIPKLLRGLQQLYLNEDLRQKVFDLLIQEISPQADKCNGRPGMPLWNILVLGVLRLDLNADYDRIHELSNQHRTLRAMLGHGAFNEQDYHYQTILDNVSLFTPELLEKLNTLVVQEGHALLKKVDDVAVLGGRCDSFVVETNVHYPTDINLLFDAMRKAIEEVAAWCGFAGQTFFRQHQHSIRKLKRAFRRAQLSKRQQRDPKATIKAHQAYLSLAEGYLMQISLTEQQLRTIAPSPIHQQSLTNWLKHALRQIDQIERRVIKGETIPAHEKTYSIFEPHTEWISKGKAGVPVELGLRVCILEDQHQFILHHRVMENETDDKVAVAMVQDSQRKFPNLRLCSFDKGFHSPANQTDLADCLDHVGLSRKGKLSETAKQHEQSAGFKQARRKHSAVESAINALEVHGLDYCPDRGLHGFKRYVALAVLARNIHRLGDILWQQDIARERRRQAAIEGHRRRRAA